MVELLDTINAVIWGIPVLLLILMVGIVYSFRSKMAQLQLFPDALRQFFSSFQTDSNRNHEISGYRALCTALAATVGTGNLAGVAGAIAIGGPGAIFWMWICALLGMVTKLAEVTLAVRFRVKKQEGEYIGGPMYMIQQGMPPRWHFLAVIYSFFGVIAAFGIGNATQINTVMTGFHSIFETVGIHESIVGDLVLGSILAILVTLTCAGGMKRIGSCAEKLVPLAAIGYIILALGVILKHITQIPSVIYSIILGAFQPKAVTGGIVGIIFQTIRIGASRGVFTNEAGMGTASIAHACANVTHPIEQGLLGIIEVFLDTVVICTITALVILVSGIPISYGEDTGLALTLQAFVSVYGTWVMIPIVIIVCLLAFATILGWGLYGGRCVQYLFGGAAWNYYLLFQAAAVVLGAVVNTSVVWSISEIVNGLMAIPNLIALVFLSPEFFKILDNYVQHKKRYRPS